MLEFLQMMKHSAVIFCIFSAALIVVPFGVFAQAPTLDDSLVISQTPERPRAQETVEFEVKSYVTDLDRAQISWFYDGDLKKNGFGETQFKIVSGALGSSHTVTVLAQTAEGRSLERETVIRPAEVDIFFEAHTYTPPFYKGKALQTSESEVLLLAVPSFVSDSGNSMQPKDLIYKWKREGKIIAKSSGYGKSSFVFSDTVGAPETYLSVEVSSVDGSLLAESSIFLRSLNPKVVFYPKSPLLGVMYERALSEEFLLTDDEAAITSVPYYFSPVTGTVADLSYKWKVNGVSVENAAKDIVVRKGGESGASSLSLDVESAQKLLQYAKTALTIKFGQASRDAFAR